MTDSWTLNIGNFSRSAGTQTGTVQFKPSHGLSNDELLESFSQNAEQDDKGATINVRKVSLDYMLRKLTERGFISDDEAKQYREKIETKQELADLIYKTHGPGDASAAADNMAYGVLLGNGIIVGENDKESIAIFSKLSRNDISTLEKVLGCDYSAGAGHFELSNLARCREQGLIQGELGLKDFSIMKFILDLNIPDGEVETTLMKERIKALYEVLSTNDTKNGNPVWATNDEEPDQGLASIKF